MPIHEKPRKGWAEAFAKAAKEYEQEGDFFEGVENEFDREEWTW